MLLHFACEGLERRCACLQQTRHVTCDVHSLRLVLVLHTATFVLQAGILTSASHFQPRTCPCTATYPASHYHSIALPPACTWLALRAVASTLAAAASHSALMGATSERSSVARTCKRSGSATVQWVIGTQGSGWVLCNLGMDGWTAQSALCSNFEQPGPSAQASKHAMPAKPSLVSPPQHLCLRLHVLAQGSEHGLLGALHRPRHHFCKAGLQAQHISHLQARMKSMALGGTHFAGWGAVWSAGRRCAARTTAALATSSGELTRLTMRWHA
jgi:hypothetical protein